MKRPLLLTLLLAAAVALKVGAVAPPIETAQDAALAPVKRADRKARARAHADAEASAAGTVELLPLAGGRALFGDADERSAVVRERLRQSAGGTYIEEILLARDSALARWPDRREAPLRVWVASAPAISGWQPEFPQRVREAFTEWQQVGVPVRFTFTLDSADADVHVGWVDHFDSPISGKTLWSRDRSWWIVGASIALAIHHNGGEALDGGAVHAIALHEVGHLLGLDHTVDNTNIMTPKVKVRELSEADRATLRLLYSLPPGSVK